MNSSKDARFKLLLGALASNFGRELDEAMALGYWIGLEDLPIQSVEVAIRRAIRESKFMPAAAELRALAGIPDGRARAALAWDTFCRAMQRHGYYRTVRFSDPVLNLVVRLLSGWLRCCDIEGEAFDTWLKKEFLEHYEAMLRSGRGSEEVSLGWFDSENGLRGYDVQPIQEVTCDYLPDQPPRIESGRRLEQRPEPERTT